MERAAIVDAHHYALAAGDMRDARVAGNGQRRVRGGHLVHVVGFAARGFLAMELLAVPARRAALAERLYRGERHVLLAEHLIRTVRVLMQRLIARHRVRSSSQVRRRIGVWAVVLVVAAAARRGAAGRKQQNERKNWILHPS